MIKPWIMSWYYYKFLRLTNGSVEQNIRSSLLEMFELFPPYSYNSPPTAKNYK